MTDPFDRFFVPLAVVAPEWVAELTPPPKTVEDVRQPRRCSADLAEREHISLAFSAGQGGCAAGAADNGCSKGCNGEFESAGRS